MLVIFSLKLIIIDIQGRGSDCDGSLGDWLHRIRVRSPDGVHRYPPQDEAEEALQLPAQEGHLRHNGPHLPGPVPPPLSYLQPTLLDCRALHEVKTSASMVKFFKMILLR